MDLRTGQRVSKPDKKMMKQKQKLDLGLKADALYCQRLRSVKDSKQSEGHSSRFVTPNGGTSTPNGRTATPNGRTTTPNGRNATPNGRNATPNGWTATPNSRKATPNGWTTTPNDQLAPPTIKRKGLISNELCLFTKNGPLQH